MGISNLQALNGSWVKVEMIATGRTYVNGNGETKEATTFKFLQVFADEAACRAAKGGNGAGTPAPAPQQAPAGGDARRATALKFLKPYVENACRQSRGDVDKARELLTPMIANQKLLAEFFTVDSPEVIDLMTATLAPF